jgi:hypothetical protein
MMLTREEIMRQWDSWRRYIRDGGGASWPRDAFEAVLDHYDEENAKLRAALEPFADVSGEGTDDYPDDTPVVVTCGRSTYYALKLGDFRRAAKAYR